MGYVLGYDFQGSRLNDILYFISFFSLYFRNVDRSLYYFNLKLLFSYTVVPSALIVSIINTSFS